MIFRDDAPPAPAWRDHLQATYRGDEDALVADLLAEAAIPAEARDRIGRTAYTLVEAVRANRTLRSGIDAFMNEYDLSTEEGLVLMCLAEALLRVPDPETADRLIHDKIAGTDWEKHLGSSRSIFVNASTLGLMLTGRILGPTDLPVDAPQGTLRRMVARLGEPVIRQALRQAMRVMGRQFVLGRTIEEAMERGQEMVKKGYRYSFDMLGEAARTEEDAARYYRAYQTAIDAIGRNAAGKGVIEGNGISVKLSALHPRYEPARRAEMLDVLAGRLLTLARQARQYDIGFCVDAEEAERLELSLELIEKVYADPSLEGWNGFGLAIQAYAKRTRAVIDVLAGMVERVGRRMNVRLVKGAYWDTEIKRSQELGLEGYPVWTRKVTTDVSYIACAKKLLARDDLFFPQFATHNAHTVATILELGGDKAFEFQRLHGMGEELYDEIVGHNKRNVPCRIYAPVGGHAELLSYLVRRLLENGANTSFVNRLVDDRTPIEAIITDPVERLASLTPKRHPHIPQPRDLFPDGRLNARGIDLSDFTRLAPVDRAMEAAGCGSWQGGPVIGGSLRTGNGRPVTDPADRSRVVGHLTEATADDVQEALARAEAAWQDWDATDPDTRARCFETVAAMMEARMPALMALCVREAGKTVSDAVAEVREAVDFLRYYARRCRETFGQAVAMPTLDGGRAAQVEMRGRGIFLCISPWNFPLAIFTGQVTAALAAGNAVIAKPAEQTSLIAAATVALFHEAGVPGDVLALLPGRGETVGATLVKDPRVAGVAFTGSVEVAHIISRALAERAGGTAPLIAETGGQNAMIVDSSALPEQVIRDAILSAFGSAGQRCSALRVMYVQEDVADGMIAMLKGAMEELTVGDPALLTTDVGPVIDDDARAGLLAHAARMDRDARLIHRVDVPAACDGGTFFAPVAYEIRDISVLEREVFGPVLHVVRYKASELDAVVKAIRDTRFGLTMGIHTRIDRKARNIHAQSRIGNTYVNRNMIGAVVGVQPFGGEGLSGTGPKAGGPHYIARFARPVAQAVEDEGRADEVRGVEMNAGKLLPGDLPRAEGSHTGLHQALDAARTAAPAWDRLGGVRRGTMLEDAAEALSRAAPLAAAVIARATGRGLGDAAGEVVAAREILYTLAEQARSEFGKAVRLPGPTGEHNELQLHGRGITVCITGDGAFFAAAVAQVAAALAAGCTVVAAPDAALAVAVERLVGVLHQAGVPAGVLTLVEGADPLALAADERVEAVAWRGSEDVQRQLAVTLAGRPGPIVPLVVEAFGPHYAHRFAAERTLTIDMTAAGGNASLLTLNEDAPAGTTQAA
ncbi:bifunctional proline dehydrogenase/L-glutamate gamma-semialdehyde dehydrogenase PutA [Caenispirillum bisanense]|uniref:bifunctional proline dehydrogenase/L-glutamate gamma-semialdehyde dehydrogenase PutA n=1 Tax=Caenispirillum bisanense TaxID=414052 RepID=UPI0031DABF36